MVVLRKNIVEENTFLCFNRRYCMFRLVHVVDYATVHSVLQLNFTGNSAFKKLGFDNLVSIWERK